MKTILAMLSLSLGLLAAGSAEAARVKCKFSIEPCTDMAEEGGNFCPRHKCASYGCKEMVAVLQRPKWAKPPVMRMGFSSSGGGAMQREKDKFYIAHYCKRHMCARQLTRSKNAGIDWRFTNELNDDQGVSLFFCDREKLADGKYCLKHACKVSSCGSQRLESWKKGIGGDRTFVDADKAEWFVGVCETCQSHTSKDPATIAERSGKSAQTEGDRKRARDEARAAKEAERKAKREAEKAAREAAKAAAAQQTAESAEPAGADETPSAPEAESGK